MVAMVVKKYLIVIIWTDIATAMWSVMLEGMITISIFTEKQNEKITLRFLARICTEQRCFLRSVDYNVQARTTLQHHNVSIKMVFWQKFLHLHYYLRTAVVILIKVRLIVQSCIYLAEKIKSNLWNYNKVFVQPQKPFSYHNTATLMFSETGIVP